jgi:coatomer protein complex subunit gamma
VKVLPCARLEYNISGVCYVIVSTPEDVAEWVGTISPTLKFVVKDCDPTTGEPDSNEGYDLKQWFSTFIICNTLS